MTGSIFPCGLNSMPVAGRKNVKKRARRRMENFLV